jgi:hypothetical protein
MLYFNGINGNNGTYTQPPLTNEELLKIIRNEPTIDNFADLKNRQQQKNHNHYGVKAGINPKKIAETGWGVIFSQHTDEAIIEALKPLLDLRREQANKYFKIYQNESAYKTGESKNKFLVRNGASPGPADPSNVPYYLLLVGDPTEIPFQFQYQLDVQYAVGRIYFETVEEYYNYACSVVAAEQGKLQLSRDIALFGVNNDQATKLSAEHLITPIYKYLQNNAQDWQTKLYLKDQATKSQLTKLLGGNETPALLFTASHGIEFPLNDKRQLSHQGALLCQDWHYGQQSISPDFYFSADDLNQSNSLLGLISFHFACYSAGTPEYNQFNLNQQKKPIAPHAFVANLPMKMLSNPQGGALAVIGHIERAWGYSFFWSGANSQTTTFTSTLAQLLDGYPVGAAIEYFDERYAELSTDLNIKMQEKEEGMIIDDNELINIWTANNDARNYIILGDPAVRLPIAQSDEKTQQRPQLKLNPIKKPVEKLIENTSMNNTNIAHTDFGIGQDIAQSIKNVSQKITSTFASAIDDFSNLEIKTYTCDDINIDYDKQQRTFNDKVKLQALTKISLDGDVTNVLPRKKNMELNHELWAIHQESVKLAQQNRLEFIKAMTEVTNSLVKIIK